MIVARAVVAAPREQRAQRDAGARRVVPAAGGAVERPRDDEGVRPQPCRQHERREGEGGRGEEVETRPAGAGRRPPRRRRRERAGSARRPLRPSRPGRPGRSRDRAPSARPGRRRRFGRASPRCCRPRRRRWRRTGAQSSRGGWPPPPPRPGHGNGQRGGQAGASSDPARERRHGDRRRGTSQRPAAPAAARERVAAGDLERQQGVRRCARAAERGQHLRADEHAQRPAPKSDRVRPYGVPGHGRRFPRGTLERLNGPDAFRRTQPRAGGVGSLPAVHTPAGTPCAPAWEPAGLSGRAP